MKQTGRKIILHHVPPWVDPDASLYFITVCCKQRGTNQLCLPGTGGALLESVRFYQTQQKWFPWLFLLMPDHVHMIVTFGRANRIEAAVAGWKRYAATKHGTVWQQGFFEHWLRRNESANEKAEYIRQNPIRAGLVSELSGWPFFLESRQNEGLPRRGIPTSVLERRGRGLAYRLCLLHFPDLIL